ncbi:zinc dependent phospholipase C family protein [Olivibacter sp. CPCC 100613]|uniref:zinc dependent phospholipase C family protein n=1 Tax=Olivibacter sp. CPCC 100613 TaxID=3079931 RepID=UPI002FF746F6
MNRNLLFLLASLTLFFLCSWGFYAHKEINRLAVFTLPGQLAPLYKKHLLYLSEHAVDADKRRYANEYEAARHYIDIDAYGSHPFDSLPKYWSEAVSKYSEDTLNSRGIVPWQINRTYRLLTSAFSNRELSKILRYSADLGHYIADAHVPLHTTHNYNGQFTNQVGIHAFWESRLPELFAKRYNFIVGRAQYITDPLEEAWKIVQESFALVDSVLRLESTLNRQHPPETKYTYENRSRTLERVYTRSYSTAYHQLLNGMVEKQMRKSVLATGSFWYSAWVDAGQPKVDDLLKRNDQPLIKAEKDTISANSKALGREEWQ